MTQIYKGIITHKKSKKHPTGTYRTTEGVTDDYALAQAFGREGSLRSNNANGKVSMFELMPQEDNDTVAVDMADLTQVDALAYIRKNFSAIQDVTALTRYMYSNQYSILKSALLDISPFENNLGNLNEIQQVAVCLYYFGGMTKEEAIKEIKQNDDPELGFNNVILNAILRKDTALTKVIRGIPVTVRATMQRFDFNNPSQVILTYAITSINVEAGSLSGNGNNKQAKALKEQIKKIKALANDPEDLDVKLTFIHNTKADAFNMQEAKNIIGELKRDVNEDEIKIAKEALQHFEKINFDFDFNFVPSASWKALLTELVLDAGSFPLTAEVKDLENYQDKKQTAKAFMVTHSDYFKTRFINQLRNRFEPNQDSAEAYAKRALETVKQDFIDVDDTVALKYGKDIALQAMESYQAKVTSVSDVVELYKTYRLTNYVHDHAIIDDVVKNLLSKLADLQSDNNSEVTKLAIQKLREQISYNAKIELEKFVVDHPNGKSKNLDEQYLNQFLEQRVNEFMVSNKKLTKGTYEDAVKYFLTQEQGKPTEFYLQNVPHTPQSQGEFVPKTALQLYNDALSKVYSNHSVDVNTLNEPLKEVGKTLVPLVMSGGFAEQIYDKAVNNSDFEATVKEEYTKTLIAVIKLFDSTIDFETRKTETFEQVSQEANVDIETLQKVAKEKNVNVLEHKVSELVDLLTPEKADNSAEDNSETQDLSSNDYQAIFNKHVEDSVYEYFDGKGVTRLVLNKVGLPLTKYSESYQTNFPSVLTYYTNKQNEYNNFKVFLDELVKPNIIRQDFNLEKDYNDLTSKVNRVDVEKIKEEVGGDATDLEIVLKSNENGAFDLYSGEITVQEFVDKYMAKEDKE